MRVRTIGALVASVCLAACGDAQFLAERTGTSASAIVGGGADTGDLAVVALTVKGATLCTGALIGPHVVLSAGHCVGDTAVFGSTVSTATQKVAVSKIVKHPKYTGMGQDYDVAVFLLDEDVTAVDPLLVNTTRVLSDADVGTDVRHVGFGVTVENTPLGIGTKNKITYPITKVEPIKLWSGGNGKQTCIFDSGGPVLMHIDGVEQIVAVVSDGPNCHDPGYDDRVDAPEIAAWIAQYLPPATVLDAGPADGSTVASDASPSIGSTPVARAADSGLSPEPNQQDAGIDDTSDDGSSSGCAVGERRAASSSSLVLLALGAVLVRRRRRQA